MLGRGAEIGQVALAYRADLAIWDVSGVAAAGTWDPAALLLAGPTRARDLIVEGRRVVAEGLLVTLDLPITLERQQRLPEGLAWES